MLTAMLVAAGVAGLVPVVPALAIAVISHQPLVAVPLVVVAASHARRRRNRRSRHDIVAGFLRLMASELRAGRSLRIALVEGVSAHGELGLSQVGRMARAGRPLDEVAAVLAARPGLTAAAAALRVASWTGGSAAPAFESLAADAGDEAALERERRELTVGARLSVMLVAGFPLAVFAHQVVSGQAAVLATSGPLGLGAVVAGLSLLAGGITVTVAMLKVARR